MLTAERTVPLDQYTRDCLAQMHTIYHGNFFELHQSEQDPHPV